jgi:putative inorganic carbon (HCO3(-)) transporter
MRDELSARAGWYLLAALLLFAPLIQGGSPRLPTMIVQCAILLLAIFWLYELGWKAPCQVLKVTVMDGLLALFLFWALFSFLFAPYQHSAGRGLLLLLCYSLLYWWLVFHPSPRGFETALYAAVAQGAFQAGLVWYRWEGAASPRPAGTFHNINFMAGFLAVCVLLAAARVIIPAGRRPPPAVTAAWSAAALLMGSALFMSGSRGGVLAFAAGMVLLLWFRRPALALGGAAAGLAALFLVPNPWVSRLANLTEVDVYAYSRLAIWKSSLKMMFDHPWFGVGLGQFEYFSPRYAFPVTSHWARYGRVAENAHNEYLQVGAEMGVVGLVLWLTGLALLLFWFLRAIRGKGAAAKGAVVPAGAAMAAMLAHAVVDFILHVPPLALLLVLLAAGIRVRGVAGPSWIMEFRFRKGYSLGLFVLFVFLTGFAVRPVVGFWHFLDGIGSPRNLLHEKWSLEEAPRREITHADAVRSLEKAVAVDPRNSAYHNALGSRYFRMSLLEGDSGELRRKGLFHANYAAELNPNNERYANSLGEAMESLSGVSGDPRFLGEALSHYRRVRSLTPRNYAIHEKIGFVAETLGNMEEAEEMFRRAVTLEPNYLRGWYNLGVFLARRERPDAARRAMQQGAEAAAVERKVDTAYERRLVDFDGQMFDNWLLEDGQQRNSNQL